jgi:ankyrin repeat protein
MMCEKCNKELCACSELFDPAKFAGFAQAIFQETSLQPFINHEELNHEELNPKELNLRVHRISHGATHHARVAIWVRILANLCKALGISDQEELSERNIRLLQYVALFHDAARESDKGKDIWEAKSAAACKVFLLGKGISEKEAEHFSSLIIKKENPGLLGKILQSADCLDIMRCKKVFDVTRMLLYPEFEKSEEAIEHFLNLVKDAGSLIRAQWDMLEDVWVSFPEEKGIQFEKSRDEKNPQLKKNYELAANCYEQVEKDLKNFSSLGRLYSEPVLPPLEENKEYKKESNNFFAQPEILSYTVIVMNALPAKENLRQKEIYLQKTRLKLAYVCLTPDGELAQGFISRRKIPTLADDAGDADANFSQEKTVTDELKQRILQWLLENKTAVVFQKALRADEHMFFDDFIRMLGGEADYKEADDEQQEDAKEADDEQQKDAEENEELNEIILRRAREAKKGIYNVKRGEIFISDIDEAGKMIFYGTNEDGTSNKIRLKPYHTEAEKKGYSKPQSVSVISDKIPRQPIFQFGQAGKMPPVVALFPQSATLSHGYFSRQDEGTVGRPGDFGSYAEAREYCLRKYGGEDPSIRTEQALLIKDLAAGKNIGNTEAMMRLKWVDYTLSFGEEKKATQKGEIYFWRKKNKLAYTLILHSKEIKEIVVIAHFDKNDLEQMEIKLDTLSQDNFYLAEEKLFYALRVRGHALKPCSLGLPAEHTLSSRILTQNLAERIRSVFGKKPRIVYMAAFPEEVLYTEALQKNDREEAERIADDSKELSAALAKNDFYFLLGLAPEKLKVILNEDSAKLLIDFYAKGYVDFAKQLSVRAEIKLEEAVRAFDWASMSEVHHTAVQELALYYTEQYITLSACVINKIDHGGKTVLDVALYFGRLKLGVALLRHTKINEEKRQETGVKLLTLAMMKGYKNMTQILSPHYFSHPLLLYAAENGHQTVVEALLKDSLVDRNFQTERGKTALILAAENGHQTVVEALLKDPLVHRNLQTKCGKTALTLAAKNGHQTVVEALLKDPLVDRNFQFKHNETALIFAAGNGHIEMVRMLIDDQNTNPNLQDNNGNTALIIAAACGHTKIVEILLEGQKTILNHKNMSGETALIWATKKGYTEIVKELLAHQDIKPNLQDENGNTALIIAAVCGHTEIVKKLLAHQNIEPNLQDKNGNTALMFAKKMLAEENYYFAEKNNYIEIVKMLFPEEKKQHAASADALGMSMQAIFQAESDGQGKKPHLSP